jgi:hypothetical protein
VAAACAALRFQPPFANVTVVAGWEKPWVEQIVDRVMKNMLRTTEERASAVVRKMLQLDYRIRAGVQR